MTRQRADVTLADRGLFPSREKARAAILAGEVRVDGERIAKAGALIDIDAKIELADVARYVSRGGLKLDGALARFGFDVSGVRAIDVGASTGGFTDCLLQHGAANVVAVDVGYGQLAWSLRSDERVSVFERTNIRHADPEALGAPFDLAVVDVSFIGLTKILSKLSELLDDEGTLLALVKPQFEAGKSNVGKRGVVRDPAVHQAVLDSLISELPRHGFYLRGATWSPVTGPEGNIEFWMIADRDASASALDMDTATLVRAAREELGA